jgi:hypothetical protein
MNIETKKSAVLIPNKHMAGVICLEWDNQKYYFFKCVVSNSFISGVEANYKAILSVLVFISGFAPLSNSTFATSVRPNDEVANNAV